MSAERIQVSYEQLRLAAAQSDQYAEQVGRIIGQISHGMEGLHRFDWEGDAARCFFREIECEVLPATVRLEKSLEAAARVINELCLLYHQAEEEASGLFQGESLPGHTYSGTKILSPVQFRRVTSPLLPDWIATQIGHGMAWVKLTKGIPGSVGFVVGTILDGLTSDDPDAARRWGSAAIGNGLSLYPPVGGAMAANSIVQGVGDMEIFREHEWNQWLATNPIVLEEMEESTARLDTNLDQINLDHLQDDLGNLGWDLLSGGTNLEEQYWNFRENPSDLQNLAAVGSAGLGAVALLNPYTSAFYFAERMNRDSAFREKILTDGGEILLNASKLVQGSVDLPASISDRVGIVSLNLMDRFVTANSHLPDSWNTSFSQFTIDTMKSINDRNPLNALLQEM